MLLPTLGRAREQANISACASNLRQLAVAGSMYVNDNKGFLPPWTINTKDKFSWWSNSVRGPYWDNQLAKYIKAPNSMACPTVRSSPLAENTFGNPGPQFDRDNWRTYKINGGRSATTGLSVSGFSYLQSFPKPAKVTQFKQQYELAWFLEDYARSQTGGLNVDGWSGPFSTTFSLVFRGWNDTMYPPHFNKRTSGTFKDIWGTVDVPRSRGRINVAFLDGHVASFEQRLVTGTEGIDGVRLNP